MLTGILLALLMFAGLVFEFRNLPIWLQRFVRKHPFIADAGVSYGAWAAISSVSKSIVALVAATVLGLLIGIALEVTKNDEQP
jgi:hypothetical protein